MNKEDLLDAYINRSFSDIECMSLEERKIVADSIGFACFQLQVAWTEFKESVCEEVPFLEKINESKE